MPKTRRLSRTEALEVLAGVTAILWALAQVHVALAAGVGGLGLVSFNVVRLLSRGD